MINFLVFALAVANSYSLVGFLAADIKFLKDLQIATYFSAECVRLIYQYMTENELSLRGEYEIVQRSAVYTVAGGLFHSVAWNRMESKKEFLNKYFKRHFTTSATKRGIMARVSSWVMSVFNQPRDEYSITHNWPFDDPPSEATQMVISSPSFESMAAPPSEPGQFKEARDLLRDYESISNFFTELAAKGGASGLSESGYTDFLAEIEFMVQYPSEGATLAILDRIRNLNEALEGAKLLVGTFRMEPVDDVFLWACQRAVDTLVDASSRESDEYIREQVLERASVVRSTIDELISQQRRPTR